MPGGKSVVVSKTLRPEEHPGIEIVAGDLKAAVSRLKAEPGKDIWLADGGVLFRSLLDAGLVDTVEVAVIPVLLGGGIPLLAAPAGRTKLRLVKTKTYKTGIVALDYAVE